MEVEQKAAPVIILDSKLRTAIDDYIKFRGYAIWTENKYRKAIDKVYQQYTKLEMKDCRKIAAGKNPNQRAILNLILKAASHSDIELPSIKITRRIKPKTRELPEHIYNISEVKNIINQIKEERDRLFFRCVFSIGAGLRISEVIKLKWGDLNFKSWVQDKEKQGEARIRKTKRGRSYTLPVPKILMDDLLQYGLKNSPTRMEYYGLGVGFKKVPIEQNYVFQFPTKDFDKLGFLKAGEPEQYLFKYINQIYHYVNYHIIRKQIEPYLGHRLKIHGLRHARATQLVNEGVKISDIKNMLGHASLDTTMIYLDTSAAELAKVTKDIPSV